MSPSAISFPGTRNITYRLTLRTGELPERVTVRVTPPLYSATFDGEPRVEGALIGEPDVLRMSGPALVEEQGGTRGLPACSPARNAPHGYEPVGQHVKLLLPAEATETLTVTYQTGGIAPWPRMDYRLKFTILDQGLTRPPRPPQTIRPRQQAFRGKRGVRISFATSPPSERISGSTEVRTVPSGERVAIFGQVDPRSARGRIVLRYLTEPRGSPFRHIATVRLDDRGRFSYRSWRPRKPGYYEIWPFYVPSERHLLRDYACPRAFEVVSR